MALGYNQSGNKQLWLGDLDYAGTTSGYFTRCVNYAGAALVDCVRGDGTVTGTLLLGSSGGSKVSIGDTNAATSNSTSPGSLLFINGNVTIGSASRTTAAPTDGLYVQGSTLLNGNVGFYGTTPVAQPTRAGTTAGYNAGTGSTVLSGSAFTGNVGSTTYTIRDIVKCLKTLGLLTA